MCHLLNHRRGLGTFITAAVATMPTLTAAAATTVLQTDFGPGHYSVSDQRFSLDWSTRPSGAAVKQFFIDTGLDAQMSNGQMISDVVTDAPTAWDPPYYNPLLWYSGYLEGSINFGPATGILEIDVEALETAVNASAASIPVIRGEILKREGDTETVVVLGEKSDFVFGATDFGSGVTFHLFWTNLGFDAGSWYDDGAEYCLRITVGEDEGACCICDTCIIATADECDAAGGSFLGAGTRCADVTCPEPHDPQVLQTAFGPGYYDAPAQRFTLDWSTRPSRNAVRNLFIETGLDAQMSNGQMISDVITDAPAEWDPPFYNPLLWHTPYLGGSINFGPATGILEIDEAALNAAVDTNADHIPVVRGEILKRLDAEETAVVVGEKSDFVFESIDTGSGVTFHLFWTNLGMDAATWFDPAAEYCLRITVGCGPTNGACCVGTGCLYGSEVACDAAGGTFMGVGSHCADLACPAPCPADANGDGEIGFDDLLSVISTWGPCP